MKIDPKKLYTKTAFARKIGKSRAQLDKWLKSGKYKAVKINGSTLVLDE
jgi:hypothetical protein